MNEKLNLVKILKGCPEGTKFYNTVYGECTLLKVSVHLYYPIVLKAYSEYKNSYSEIRLTRDGRTEYSYNGECTLFPSRTQRDWSKFERFWDKPKVEKFDPKTLEQFDKVLVRGQNEQNWTATFFSHIDNIINMVVCGAQYWKHCIPYNDETKHLCGTNNDCPDYYKWWEEQI